MLVKFTISVEYYFSALHDRVLHEGHMQQQQATDSNKKNNSSFFILLSILPLVSCTAAAAAMRTIEMRGRAAMLLFPFFKTIDLSNCCQDSSLGGVVYTCSCNALRVLA